MVIHCDWCGGLCEKYPSQIKAHNFCCRACLAAFSSKKKNPEEYQKLKNYTGMRQNMAVLNRQLNPGRMTPAVRFKLRQARLARGETKTGYPKMFGHHRHRIEAERILGRPLTAEEVVHHINGDKTDYRPGNLVVFPSQKEHAAWHGTHKSEVMQK